jgi:serine/threonine protein kinase
MIGTRVGRYEILTQIGGGGMGEVYLGHDPQFNRRVAIKVVRSDKVDSPQAVNRFMAESISVARLRSPYIVDAFDRGETENGMPYLVMEYVNGPTLEQLLISGANIPHAVLAAIACQITTGLESAAAKGIVHRDIKPANLIISSDGYVKVCDFGVVHLKNFDITHTHQVVGAPSYLSPEQARGVKPLTTTSDLFSLGIVLYRGLTGCMPFLGTDIVEVLEAITTKPHIPLQKMVPDIDAELARIVESLLLKDTTSRPSPATLRGQLNQYLHRIGVLDLATLISGYVQGSSGTFTTTNIDPTMVFRAASKIQAGMDAKSRSRIKAFNKKIWLLTGLAMLTVGVAGFFWMLTYDSEKLILGNATKVPMTHSPKIIASLPVFTLTDTLPKFQEKLVVPTVKKTMELQKVAVKALKIKVPPITSPSDLTIISQPPFALITLDGQTLGTTPLERHKTTSGRHRLILRSNSGGVIDTQIVLQPELNQIRLAIPD